MFENELSCRQSLPHQLAEAYRALCGGVRAFSDEIILDIRTICEKMSEFEQLIKNQFQDMANTLMKEKNKVSKGVQSVGELDQILKCALCSPNNPEPPN